MAFTPKTMYYVVRHQLGGYDLGSIHRVQVAKINPKTVDVILNRCLVRSSRQPTARHWGYHMNFGNARAMLEIALQGQIERKRRELDQLQKALAWAKDLTEDQIKEM